MKDNCAAGPDRNLAFKIKEDAHLNFGVKRTDVGGVFSTSSSTLTIN
jgi:hypothetical protein